MIVITTPTGQIGHQVLGHILNSEEAIRVIARDPSRLSVHVRERVEVVQGSHDDIDVVAEAFAGADCVFWVVPPDAHAESVKGHYLDFAEPAREAIRSQGVERVVAVSTLGRGENAGHLSAALAAEELFESTGVGYRVLRMPFFMENFLNQVEGIKIQGMFFLANAGDRKLTTVATRDVAAEAAKLLLDDSWSGQDSVPVLSPDHLSPNDMAQTLSEVLERPVRFQQVSGDAYKATLMQHGMSEAWAQGLVDMAAAQNHGFYDAEPGTASASPTSFRQWCEEVLKPAVLA
jgi:uncharacterized protein YbjT (DUF2867 family)